MGEVGGSVGVGRMEAHNLGGNLLSLRGGCYLLTLPAQDVGCAEIKGISPSIYCWLSKLLEIHILTTILEVTTNKFKWGCAIFCSG